MTSRWYAVALTGACTVAVLSTALRAQGPSDEDRIRAVLEEYVSGWRDGNVQRLTNVFATGEGRLLWVTGPPGRDSLASMTLGQALERRRPQPGYGSPWRVLSLDIVDGQLAVAKLEIARTGGSYVDYLVLYRIAGAWRIVTKTYVTR